MAAAGQTVKVPVQPGGQAWGQRSRSRPGARHSSIAPRYISHADGSTRIDTQPDTHWSIGVLTPPAAALSLSTVSRNSLSPTASLAVVRSNFSGDLSWAVPRAVIPGPACADCSHDSQASKPASHVEQNHRGLERIHRRRRRTPSSAVTTSRSGPRRAEDRPTRRGRLPR